MVTLQETLQFERAASAIMADQQQQLVPGAVVQQRRPHTISAAFAQPPSRPPISSYHFSPPPSSPGPSSNQDIYSTGQVS